ncbi:MAG: hypothetical protein EXS31_08395 [Pedosphaera sp.]|nr:hypothetical protein [Pedosphaera sp.]
MAPDGTPRQNLVNTDETRAADGKVLQALCLSCGLCCDGTLFKDVELQPGDNSQKLQSLGISVRFQSTASVQRSLSTQRPKLGKFPQPCSALCQDKSCRIYADRPKRCQEFECALFKSVAKGAMPVEVAGRTIRQARQRSDKVRRLLRELGDSNETLALSLRFRRVRRHVESNAISDEIADAYAGLTLAVHDLNMRLRADFYPSPSD